MKDQIHDILTPPIHKLMAGLSNPKPQGIVIMEIICHVVAPTKESVDRIVPFISKIDFVGIHMFPNLGTTINPLTIMQLTNNIPGTCSDTSSQDQKPPSHAYTHQTE